MIIRPWPQSHLDERGAKSILSHRAERALAKRVDADASDRWLRRLVAQVAAELTGKPAREAKSGLS
jgi:hypothetical protein